MVLTVVSCEAKSCDGRKTSVKCKVEANVSSLNFASTIIKKIVLVPINKMDDSPPKVKTPSNENLPSNKKSASKGKSPPEKSASNGSSPSNGKPLSNGKSSSGISSSNGNSVASTKASSLQRRLTSFLKHVEADIQLHDEKTKENVEIFKNTLEYLVNKMKEVDECFKVVFREIYYTGSYYDGLRISSASEFDLNAVLVFPFKEENRKVIVQQNCPSFAKFRLDERPTDLVAKMRKPYPKKIQSFFDDKNYLIPNNVRTWLKSVMTKTLNKYQREINNFAEARVDGITLKESGPACTLLLKKKDGEQIDIDFVPVVRFSYPEWPTNAEAHTKIKNAKHGTWFLVPKKYVKKNSPREPKDEDVPRLWRLHFPNVERDLIHNRGLIKPLIKFFKKLRDQEDWKILASYYLKTFVMWEIVKNPNKDWRGELGELFIDLLQKLSKAVRAMSLSYFFYPEYNLLSAMNQHQSANIANRIDVILSKIQNEPRNILQILGCKCSSVLPTLP